MEDNANGSGSDDDGPALEEQAAVVLSELPLLGSGTFRSFMTSLQASGMLALGTPPAETSPGHTRTSQEASSAVHGLEAGYSLLPISSAAVREDFLELSRR